MQGFNFFPFEFFAMLWYIYIKCAVLKGSQQYRRVRGFIMNKINESSEDYLERILILSKKLPVVRSIDIANDMGFTKASVSIAMKNLKEKGHIEVSSAGFITLTDEGRSIAEMILERHNFVMNWLISLGVDEDIAAEDACRIEHVVSKDSFEAIKKFVEEKS